MPRKKIFKGNLNSTNSTHSRKAEMGLGVYGTKVLGFPTVFIFSTAAALLIQSLDSHEFPYKTLEYVCVCMCVCVCVCVCVWCWHTSCRDSVSPVVSWKSAGLTGVLRHPALWGLEVSPLPHVERQVPSESPLQPHILRLSIKHSFLC